jgi:hypothetical protein
MQIGFVPKWRVTIEGDNRQVFNAFQDKGKVLDQKFYDQWLESRDPMFDDDPDGPYAGHFDIEGTGELMRLLSLLQTRVPNPEVNLKVALHVSGERGGVRVEVALHRESEHQRGEIIIDRAAIGNRMLDAATKARDLLEDAIYESGRDGEDVPDGT